MKTFLKSIQWTGLAAVLALSLAACGSEDGSLNAALSPDAADAAGVGFFEPPAIADLRTRLDLTAEQADRVQDLLDDWKTADASRPRPAGGRGPGHGPGFGEMPDHEPPQFAFIGGMVEILDTPQIVKLGDFMKERREERRERFTNDENFGPRGGRKGLHDRMAAMFGISEKQKEDLHAAMKTYREGMKSLRDQFESGSISAEAFRDQAKALRLTMESTAKSIVGEGTFAKIHERREERRERFSDRALDRTDRHVDRMLSLLTKALNLDASQTSQVEAILESRKPQMESILSRVKSGELGPEDALYETHRIREEGRTAIEAILTPEQLERFEAMQSLLPRGGHGPRG